MSIPARHDVDTRHRLEVAVDSGALALYYEPIVELASGCATGFEALIGIDDGNQPIPASELIEAAEDTGLITTVGDGMLGQALTDAMKLNQADDKQPRYVSVNVSARQLNQPDFVDTVRAHLATAEVDPSLLTLQITEGLLVGENDRARTSLAELRRDGTRVAIDDYGSGRAPLSYLRQPGIDIVKIDETFLTELASPRSRALLQAMTTLSSQLGHDQIAEGVRDPARPAGMSCSNSAAPTGRGLSSRAPCRSTGRHLGVPGSQGHRVTLIRNVQTPQQVEAGDRSMPGRRPPPHQQKRS